MDNAAELVAALSEASVYCNLNVYKSLSQLPFVAGWRGTAARSLVESDTPEDDLFAGIESTDGTVA